MHHLERNSYHALSPGDHEHGEAQQPELAGGWLTSVKRRRRKRRTKRPLAVESSDSASPTSSQDGRESPQLLREGLPWKPAAVVTPAASASEASTAAMPPAQAARQRQQRRNDPMLAQLQDSASTGDLANLQRPPVRSKSDLAAHTVLTTTPKGSQASAPRPLDSIPERPATKPAAAAPAAAGDGAAERGQSFADYLQAELHPGPSYPAPDVVWGQTERDRVYNAILSVPYQLERLLWFGMLICCDSFLVRSAGVWRGCVVSPQRLGRCGAQAPLSCQATHSLPTQVVLCAVCRPSSRCCLCACYKHSTHCCSRRFTAGGGGRVTTAAAACHACAAASSTIWWLCRCLSPLWSSFGIWTRAGFTFG